MKTYPTRIAVSVLATLIGLTACRYQQPSSQAPPDTRAADERTIRALQIEWSKVASTKDLEKTLSFYAPDASIFPPNSPVATTREQRRQVWVESLAIPGFALSAVTTRVEVAKAGDLAAEIGSYELTTNDKKGKPVISKGKYVVVWKKQANGNWKAIADIWNADQ